ncbi:MAG: NUDIX hydrolase [Anaerolineae bacterium]
MFDSLPDLPLHRRWRNQLYPGPVVVALIQRQTAVASPCYLLIRRKSDSYTGQWALVGGKWDFGETLVTAVTREVEEETGLAASFTALRGMVSERLVPPNQEKQAAHFLIFVCEMTAPDGDAREQNEGAVAWFTRTEIDRALPHHNRAAGYYPVLVCQLPEKRCPAALSGGPKSNTEV